MRAMRGGLDRQSSSKNGWDEERIPIRWSPAIVDSRGEQRRELARADITRRLVNFADFLDSDDSCLIKAVYEDHMEPVRIAQLLKIDPRQIRSRLRRLVRRVCSPTFALVVANLEHLESERARVARTCILQGHSLRKAAAELEISIHAVRIHRAAVLGMVETLIRAGRARLESMGETPSRRSSTSGSLIGNIDRPIKTFASPSKPIPGRSEEVLGMEKVEASRVLGEEVEGVRGGVEGHKARRIMRSTRLETGASPILGHEEGNTRYERP